MMIKAANDEEADATFKPKTLSYPRAATTTSGDKCIDLYKRVKEGQYARNRGPEDPDYER